jgi:alpha-tubulin suppressor-like RCC1 family protein
MKTKLNCSRGVLVLVVLLLQFTWVNTFNVVGTGVTTSGQLGVNSSSPLLVATLFSSNLFDNDTIVQISIGLNHTMILTASNKVYAMGSALGGRMCIGEFDQSNPIYTTPTLVMDSNNVLVNKTIKVVRAGAFVSHILTT